MADITDGDLRKLFDELRQMNKGFGAMLKGLSGRDQAVEALEQSIASDKKARKQEAEREKNERKSERRQKRYEGQHKARDITRFFDGLGAGANNATKSLQALSTFVLGGFVGGLANSLVDFSSGLTKTYTDMADVGQNFSGDIFKMASEAAAAGLSLTDFSNMIKKSSVAASIMSNGKGGSLPMLAKSVRDASEKAGMYGYTLDGLNDITSMYANQVRSTGKLETMDRQQASEDIQELAKSAAGLSATFGKSRTEILKTWDTAMNHEQIMASKMMMSEEQIKKFNKGIGEEIMILSSQSGKYGNTLAEMAAEAAGAGTAVFSNGAKTFVDAGMGQIVGMVESMTQDVQADPDHADEITAAAQNKMNAAIRANLPSLKIQALAGNQAAKEVLEFSRNMQDVTADQIKKKKQDSETQTKFTKFMLTIENMWNSITGKVRGFLINVLGKSIEDVAEKLETWVNSDSFTDFMKQVQKAGVSFATSLGAIFNQDGSLNIEETAKRFVTNIETIGTNILAFGKFVGMVGDGFSAIGGFVNKLVGGGSGTGLPDLVVGVGAVVAGLAAAKLALGVYGAVKTLTGMRVSARNVYVNGSNVGGGGGGGGGKGGKLGKLLGGMTVVGTAAEIAQAMGGVGESPSIKDIKDSPGRSALEFLDSGLADMVYGKKPNTSDGKFDPSKTEATPMGELTGWLGKKMAETFGFDPRNTFKSITNPTIASPVTPEQIAKTQREQQEAQAQLRDNRNADGSENAEIAKRLEQINETLKQQTATLAGQNAQSQENQRRTQRAIESNFVLPGP